METRELTIIPQTTGMVTKMMDAVNIEDAVIVSEEDHPNFIELNISGITFEALERTVSYPVSVITSLQSATRYSFTKWKRLQRLILQVRTLEIPKSESRMRYLEEIRVH